jgi:predicted AlkP superfamily pyrophosphatase or phosphodiesterase
MIRKLMLALAGLIATAHVARAEDAAKPVAETSAAPAKYVLQMSIDGLGSSYLQKLIDAGELPTFKRLQQEAAFTHNARTDFDFTITLPNHTCMVTGRPVRDKAASPAAIPGHTWTINTDPGERNLHSNRKEYVPSVFDVAHDHGLRTGAFVSKSKFSLYDQSYDERNGAPDTTGEDNGRDKIDVYVKEGCEEMTDKFIAEMKANPFQYAFLHFADTDSAGHSKKWGSPEYNEALRKVDGLLAKILAMIDGDERFRGKTAIIISADHGGIDFNHGFNTNPLNYTIPFYVWGAGVKPTSDLYSHNNGTRVNPEAGRPDYTETGKQPIRNGDGGNLALTLLGLPPIPTSTINAAQDLKVQ